MGFGPIRIPRHAGGDRALPRRWRPATSYSYPDSPGLTRRRAPCHRAASMRRPSSVCELADGRRRRGCQHGARGQDDRLPCGRGRLFGDESQLFAEFFPLAPPARATPIVSLPRGLRISIDEPSSSAEADSRAGSAGSRLRRHRLGSRALATSDRSQPSRTVDEDAATAPGPGWSPHAGKVRGRPGSRLPYRHPSLDRPRMLDVLRGAVAGAQV